MKFEPHIPYTFYSIKTYVSNGSRTLQNKWVYDLLNGNVCDPEWAICVYNIDLLDTGVPKLFTSKIATV